MQKIISKKLKLGVDIQKYECYYMQAVPLMVRDSRGIRAGKNTFGQRVHIDN